MLIVEDDATPCDLFADALRSTGYQVAVAAHGAEALAQVGAEPFDVLITDILMPDLDGWQLTARAVEQQPMLRCIARTGADAVEHGRRAEALGLPLLRKPFSLGALQDALRGVSARSRR